MTSRHLANRSDPVLMQRRTFLAVCGAAAASGCASLPFVAATLEGAQLILNVKDIEPRRGALVEHPSLAFPVYVRRRDNGEYSAVFTRCMHRGCTVEPGDQRLVCPCHGSEYSLTGAILKGPTELPLHVFPVRVDGERLIILELDRAPR